MDFLRNLKNININHSWNGHDKKCQGNTHYYCDRFLLCTIFLYPFDSFRKISKFIAHTWLRISYVHIKDFCNIQNAEILFLKPSYYDRCQLCKERFQNCIYWNVQPFWEGFYLFFSYISMNIRVPQNIREIII